MKMAVAGARPSEKNYRLNGSGVNDYANTTPGNALGTNLGVEALGEFSVLTKLPFLYLYETPLNRSTPLFLQGVALDPPGGSFPSGAYSLLGVQTLRTAWVDPNPPRAYWTPWNVDIQRQFGVWTAEAGDVGARGMNLPLVERDMNTVLPTKVDGRWIYPPRAASTVLNPNFSAFNTTITGNAESIEAASAYESATHHRIPPPAFGPLPAKTSRSR